MILLITDLKNDFTSDNRLSAALFIGVAVGLSVVHDCNGSSCVECCSGVLRAYLLVRFCFVNIVQVKRFFLLALNSFQYIVFTIFLFWCRLL